MSLAMLWKTNLEDQERNRRIRLRRILGDEWGGFEMNGNISESTPTADFNINSVEIPSFLTILLSSDSEWNIRKFV
jgi:hypothetical protein